MARDVVNRAQLIAPATAPRPNLTPFRSILPNRLGCCLCWVPPRLTPCPPNGSLTIRLDVSGMSAKHATNAGPRLGPHRRRGRAHPGIVGAMLWLLERTFAVARSLSSRNYLLELAEAGTLLAAYAMMAAESRDARKSKWPFRALISAVKLFEQVDLPNGRPKTVQFLTCSFHFEFWWSEPWNRTGRKKLPNEA